MIRTIQNGFQCDGDHIPTQNGVNIYALCNIGIVISEYLIIFAKFIYWSYVSFTS